MRVEGVSVYLHITVTVADKGYTAISEKTTRLLYDWPMTTISVT